MSSTAETSYSNDDAAGSDVIAATVTLVSDSQNSNNQSQPDAAATATESISKAGRTQQHSTNPEAPQQQQSLVVASAIDEPTVVVADPVVVTQPSKHRSPNESSEAAPTTRPKSSVKVYGCLALAIVVVVAILLGLLLAPDAEPVKPYATTEGGGSEAALLERRASMVTLLAQLYEDGAAIFDDEIGAMEGSDHRRAALEWILNDGVEVPDRNDNDNDNDNDDYLEDSTDDEPFNFTAATVSSVTVTTVAVDTDSDKYETKVFKVLERYVLAVLYFATNGDSWDDDYRFLHDSDVCRWTSFHSAQAAAGENEPFEEEIKGVICNDNGQLLELKMWWNNLSGTIPHELSLFRDTLVTINIGGSSLGGTIPSSLGQLTKLESLNLFDSCLEGRFPDPILELPDLSILIINNNNGMLDFDVTIDKDDGTASSALGNQFCDGSNRREGKIAISVDCPSPSEDDMYDDGFVGNSTAAAQPAPWGCECCVCCDPDAYRCDDPVSGSIWSSLYLDYHSASEAARSFSGQCLTQNQKSWISRECPCLVPGEFTPFNGVRECTTDCTSDEAILSVDLGGDHNGMRHGLLRHRRK